jgi:phosphoribosylglycinamide formyltransferase 1
MAGDKKRLVIMISGRGSNMSAILSACQKGDIPAEVVGVVSNKANAAGLDIAKASGVATTVVEHDLFHTREAFDKALLDAVTAYQPDFVILAGFMRILTGVFVKPLLGRLVNIHPSLLPKYPGLNTHQRAIDAGDSEAGATVHFVTEELDGGPPLLQVKVPIDTEETADSLAAKVLTFEHRLYVQAVAMLCQSNLELTPDHRIQAGDTLLPETGLQFHPDSRQ